MKGNPMSLPAAIGAKQRAALWSIFASGTLAVMKLAVGLLTGSIGILSEAAHSMLDCCGTVMTYLAVRMSDRPADGDHHYGHGKIESVAALARNGPAVRHQRLDHLHRASIA